MDVRFVRTGPKEVEASKQLEKVPEGVHPMRSSPELYEEITFDPSFYFEK